LFLLFSKGAASRAFFFAIPENSLPATLQATPWRCPEFLYILSASIFPTWARNLLLMMVSEGSLKTVLLVDDDPSHLKLYSWIVSRGGFRAVTALVGSSSVDFPKGHVDVAVMDYRLSSQLSARDVARHIRAQYPDIPILLLSELLWMPDDVAGLVDAFISKGEPESLLEKLEQLVAPSSETRPPQNESSM
jgi:CheY-like chemotaxis protein